MQQPIALNDIEALCSIIEWHGSSFNDPCQSYTLK